jgi:signal transduction histidine kinase/CheY-like chemotaxis protein
MKSINNSWILSIAIIIFIAISFIHTYYLYDKVQNEQRNFALTESRILNNFMNIHIVNYQKLFYNKSIKLDETTLKSIEDFSPYSISKTFSQNNEYGIKTKTVSDRPRNPNNNADNYELKAINYFKDNQNEKEYFEYINNVTEPFYQYAYVLRMEKSCLNCHLKKDSNSYKYEIGDIRGIVSVQVPKEHTHNFIHDRFIDNTIFNITLFLLILISAIMIFNKRVKDIKILKKATFRANSANRAKSEFLANMSHEIRTPLNAILGFVDILIDEEKDKKKLKYLTTIDSSSLSLLSVINDILDFSKLESGKLQIDKISFNPIEEFKSTSALFCAKSAEKKISFNTYIDENIPQILYSDPFRIKQVLSNLLSNAIKFSHEGASIELKIKYYKDSNSIRFSVKDNGIGISREYKKNIFKPFTQAQSSTTREYGGTGLGLTISSHLVDMLGGELKVESELDKGSEFYFDITIDNVCQINMDTANLIKGNYVKGLIVSIVYSNININEKVIIKQYLNALGIENIEDFNALDVNKLKDSNIVIIDSYSFDNNLVEKILSEDKVVIVIKTSLSHSLISDLKGRVQELECPINISDLHDIILENFTGISHKPVSDEGSKIEENINFKGKNILLVEDNKANQMFMKVVLKKLEIEFDIANNGLEAIEAFKLGKYDAILMDENMPKMGGIEATKNILKIEKEKDLKHTTIIALTANALKGDREKFLAAGMDEYITKPLDKDRLIKLLNKL